MALAFVAMGLLLRFVENSLIYFPTRYPAGVWEPSLLGVSAEEVFFETADGLQLHGWWIEAQGSASSPPSAEVSEGTEGPPVLIWFHGNAGNLTYRGPHAQRLAEEGLAVFLFDYRGYGRSEGSPTEAGLYTDSEAAYEYLTTAREVAAARVVLFGRSLGSAPAARLSTRVAHAGTILVTPFPSAKSMARRMFLGLPLYWFARSEFPVGDWVEERTQPLMVIHGESDSVVPYGLGEQVFAAAAQPKEFVSLPGADHNDILLAGGSRYLDAVREFSWRCVAASHALREGGQH